MSDRASERESALRLELNRVRATLRNLIERAPLGVHRWRLASDGSLRFAGANPAADRILGIAHAPLLGKTMDEAFPPLKDTEIPAAYRKVAQTGEPYESEQVSYRDNRIEGVFEIMAFQTAPAHMAVLFRDITERRKMEISLRESEGRLQSIFRAAPIGIGVVRNRIILEANDALCRIVGRTREEIVGHSTSILYADQLDFESVGNELYQNTRALGRSIGETRFLRSDGVVVPVLLSASPLVPGDLNAGLAFTAVDLTQHKRAEEEHRNFETRMLQTQKLESLGVLAGGIAHDFNNILMAILGNADVALSQLPPTSGAREGLMEIEKASRRAADLCRQMLAYSGKGRFVIQHLDMAEVVREMRHMLEISVSRKATLRMDAGGPLPPVDADVAQLRQIIMNLVINASEALGDTAGVITVRTGVVDCDAQYLLGAVAGEGLQPGRYVFLEVADTGCGFDAPQMARIFEPFYTTKFAGRGLGLAAVLGIVRSHGGALSVRSEPGHGSTFRLLLPPGGRAVDHIDAAGTSGELWKGEGTILLVDDEEPVRNVGRRMLEALGFQVVTAADGEQAIGVFRRSPSQFACVVMDLTMPRMDGEEAYRRLREIQPEVRVLLSSGHSEQEAVRSFRGTGLAGFIQKPYQLATLSEHLRDVLGNPG